MEGETKIVMLLVFSAIVTAIFGYLVVGGFLLWTP
jgi:hypothetical protein